MTARGRVEHRGAALATAALLAAAALAACAGSKAGRGDAAAPAPPAGAAGQSAHPEVDTGIATCAQCHHEATPQVVTQWAASRHGLALVECLVCHGSTGADFKAKPGIGGCAGCHAAQVASVTKGGTAANCFACHSPHALHADGHTSPHPQQQKGS